VNNDSPAPHAWVGDARTVSALMLLNAVLPQSTGSASDWPAVLPRAVDRLLPVADCEYV